MTPFYLFIFDISINLTRTRVPPLLANASFYKVSFIHYFRIEISDHGASEGSDDTLPIMKQLLSLLMKSSLR